jgi:hypothetical protein
MEKTCNFKGVMRSAHKNVLINPERKGPFGRPIWETSIAMGAKGMNV